MTTTSAAPPLQAQLRDSFATIRSRGLCRSRSIRVNEIEAEAKCIADDDVFISNGYNHRNSIKSRNTKRPKCKTLLMEMAPLERIERRRTLSLKSNISQNSSCSGSTCHIPHHHHQRYIQRDDYQSVQLLPPQQRAQQQIPLDSHDALYVSAYQPRVCVVTTPTLSEYESLYASTNTCSTFRPLSDASSSSSGAGSIGGCRESTAGSIGSSGFLIEGQNTKKNSGFSLNSMHSSISSPKTPDFNGTEEDNIFLYTAPESPRRRHTESVTNGGSSSYTPPMIKTRNSFEMHELSDRRHSQEASSDAHSHMSSSPPKPQRGSNSSKLSLTESIARPRALLMSTSYTYQRSDPESPSGAVRSSYSPTTLPPQAPVRRESLLKPKLWAISATNRNTGTEIANKATSPPRSPTSMSRADYAIHINGYQLTPPPVLTQRSSSAEILERSFTNQSLATIEQDELLKVPSAMPVLLNSVDRRYHTLGHMRVQSLGASLHRTHDESLGSMLNALSSSHYSVGFGSMRTHYQHLNSLSLYHHLQPNRSAGNLCATSELAEADLERLVSEYVDPLDFKVGCQTTLRSKPIIPWYELAIRRDLKRQSCPPINGGREGDSGHGDGGNDVSRGSGTLTTSCSKGNKAHVVAAFEQSLSNMTSRLQQLTATAERKDGELTDMRQTIELLRKQSIQAGLTTAHMQSMGVQTQSQNQNEILSKALSSPPPPGLTGHVSRLTQQQNQKHQTNAVATNGVSSSGGTAIQRHHSSDSMCSLNSISSGCSAQDKAKKKKGWLRSSFTKAFSRNAKISKTSRHASGNHGHNNTVANHTEETNHSGNGMNNHNSTVKTANGHANAEPVGLSALATQPPALPGTPSKSNLAATAVTLIENAKPIDAIDHNHDHQMVEDLKKQLREKDLVLTDIRLEALSSASQLESLKETVNKMRAEMMSLKQNNERLQKMVTSRSLAGSEASLPGGVGHTISPSSSLAGNESRRYSLADGNTRPPMELPKRLAEEVEEENIPPAPAPEPPPAPLSPSTHIDLTPPPPALDPIPSPAHITNTTEELPDVTDGKKIAIACYLGQPESFAKYCEEIMEADEFYANGSILKASHNAISGADKSNVVANADAPAPVLLDERKVFPSVSLNEFVIAYTYISGKTTWQNLDYIVRKTFKDYVSRIDPGTNLGLNTDSITSYHLGEAKRGPEMGFPELLPCGYIIGNVRTLYICLQGVGSLAFDSLIPRSIVHRYISLLTEHRRLILCGPSGTGKSYLARRLAEFLVARSGRGNPSEAIATFNVDHKSSKELRQYLSHVAEQAAIANGASELPSVIILDNLHHASALGDVFSSLLSSGPAAKLPCIIGTMSQATCNTTNLQLHHNFRWVLTANHMEPVKGFLGRFLRRRLFQLELQTQHPQPELSTVLAWLPTVWQHINRFLEIHSSSDVTIGPRLFLSCPLDLKNSQVWFTDIWNYHLSPYLVEAVREGVQLYGRRGGAWNDPSAFIRNSYPWPYGPDSVPPLRQINAEDVGLDGIAASSGENQDPLLNMLMRLQEAANYAENQEQESDCASLDSNITPDSSQAGAE